MKKKFKKLAALFNTFVFAVSAVMPSIQAKADEKETTAYLSFADSTWAVQHWFDGNDYSPVVATNATVTGYGQYTVSLDFSGVDGGAAPNIEFFDVEIKDGETLYPGSYMNIDSVKINGEETSLGKTYTNSDNQTDTRTNLYNKWVAEVAEGRTADGDSEGCTAVPIAGDTFTDIKTLEVTFTLGDGVAFGTAAAETVETKPLPAEGTTAYLSMADNNWAYQYWFDGKDYAPVVATNATVTGYGQYTVSLDFSGVDIGACPDFAFLDVEIKGGEFYFPNSFMQIDSVKINDETVELGKTYTNSDNKEDTRTNLYNTWVTEITEGRSADGSLDNCTSTPVAGDTYKDIKTVEVTFTLMEGAGVSVEAEYVVPDDFNAFMMFADGSGAWENYQPGVAGDMRILGDGRWEVTTTAAQIGATGAAVPSDSKMVFLIDIEGLGEAMKSIDTLREAEDGSFTDCDVQAKVEIYVDGTKVNSKSSNIIMGDLEDNGRFRLELYNAYGSGTKDNPVVMPELLNPTDEIRVVFTLEGTGFNTGASLEDPNAAAEATPTVAEKAPEAADEKPVKDDGIPGGVVAVIVVAVVAAGAAGAVVVSKKKKGK